MSEDVDLVDLATASPILARQVLGRGRCVFGPDAPRRRARALVERVVHGRS